MHLEKYPIYLYKGVRSASDKVVFFVSSKLFLSITLAWFVFQGLAIALTTKFGLPPDEIYHVSFMQLFSEKGYLPFLSNQEGYYHLGEVVRTPFFLYHYLFSFLYGLVDSLNGFYVILRLFNLVLGVGSLYIVIKIADRVGVSKLVRNLSVFMLSSTLMFVFISASISYDNLFIFLSLASINLMLSLNKKVSAKDLILLLVMLAAGSLVKINFLPIALIIIIILGLSWRRNYLNIWLSYVRSFKDGKTTNVLLCILLLLLSVLVVHRYAYNIIEYKSLSPTCTQVQSVENCQKHALFVRNESIYGANRRVADKDFFEYAYDWVPLIQDRTYGVFAHKQLSPNKFVAFYIQVLFILGFIFIIRYWQRKDQLIKILIIVSAFNLLVLIVENFSIYHDTGRFSFAVHGRYAFAVLPLVYIVTNNYLVRAFKTKRIMLSIYIATSVVVFGLSSLPSYIYFTNFEWYNNQTKELFQ